MSVLGHQWLIKNSDPSQSIVQKILVNRGLVNTDEIDSFLKSSFKKGVHNPFLMKDMEKAVERLKIAIANQERIMIFGDYDVDGMSGTALLYHTFKTLGAKVSYRLPHRVEHGYGLSETFVEEFGELGIDVLVTVDCGISCKNEVALAKKKGIDVIITDHHSIPEEIPEEAHAILHPLQPSCNYPFKGLTGAGVAYKLACALIANMSSFEERENFMYDLLDLASLGTVADMGPLLDENRIIVKYGLEALRKTKWHGLQLLMSLAGVNLEEKLDVNVIGYRVGPRLNAAGRIASPYYALQLLLFDKPDERSHVLARHLEELNQKRQKMVAEALDQLHPLFDSQQQGKNILLAWNAQWHVGILGLLASRCVEKYRLPVIIMQDFGEYLVGSARSFEAFNMVEALRKQASLLKNFGGHVQAAGFTVEKSQLPAFVDAMQQHADEVLAANSWQPIIEIDAELQENDVSENLLQFLEQLQPFGIGNHEPAFLLRNAQVIQSRCVGKEQNHLQLMLQKNSRRISAIGFKFGTHAQRINHQKTLDLVCNLQANMWRGERQLQLRIVDFNEAR